jgi:hypothetical protein
MLLPLKKEENFHEQPCPLHQKYRKIQENILLKIIRQIVGDIHQNVDKSGAFLWCYSR